MVEELQRLGLRPAVMIFTAQFGWLGKYQTVLICLSSVMLPGYGVHDALQPRLVALSPPGWAAHCMHQLGNPEHPAYMVPSVLLESCPRVSSVLHSLASTSPQWSLSLSSSDWRTLSSSVWWTGPCWAG